ncbi:MAG: hypothetical protein WAU11_09095 [Ignavibacteriaceae bacterium]|jgi:hypothetical protein
MLFFTHLNLYLILFDGPILGDIVYKSLLKLGLVIIILWFSKDYFGENFFWIISSLAFYLFVFYPAYMAYKKFIEDNKNIITNSLCASCKQFDKTAVLCLKYDKHPNEDFIPCEGKNWEPK